MTTRYEPLSTGTENSLLLRTITSRIKVVSNEGDVFDTIIMPSNIKILDENVLLHLVAMNNLNFDMSENLVNYSLPLARPKNMV